MTTLPPLPEFSEEFRPRWPGDIGGYTVEAMRAYGEACAAAERGRCANLCATESVVLSRDEARGALYCAAKLRKLKESK